MFFDFLAVVVASVDSSTTAATTRSTVKYPLNLASFVAVRFFLWDGRSGHPVDPPPPHHVCRRDGERRSLTFVSVFLQPAVFVFGCLFTRTASHRTGLHRCDG